MTRAISIGELQTISASAIQALPHAVPIKNGSTTVGVLLPVRSPASHAYLSGVLDQIEAATARYSLEENQAIDALLAERGID